MLIILVSLAFLYRQGFINFKQLNFKSGKGDYKKVSFDTLVSYSNFYNEQLVCTEGYHIKIDSYNVLKTEVQSDVFVNSAWVKYTKGKESVFDSLIDKGQVAKVAVCGKFEAGRDKVFGEPAIWKKQITVEEYSLLEKAKPL